MDNGWSKYRFPKCWGKQCRLRSDAAYSGVWLYHPTLANLDFDGVYCFHVVRPSVRPCVRPRHFGFFLISWKRSDGYSSISADTLVSIRCTYIRESNGQGPILFELLPFVIVFFNAVKRFCIHYLFNQRLEFDQTCTDSSSGWGKEVIRFWWPWPCF